MKIGELLAKVFEKMPEWAIKNDLRYFLAFSPLVPNFIADLSPVKGYEKHYHLKEGDYVVDAGAYPGDYAVFASRKIGRTGKIICFEPDPNNRKILKKNLGKEKYKNWIVVPRGLWNKSMKMKLESSDGLHSSLSQKRGLQEIEVITLDSELKKLGIPKLDVLKMDIEGAEIQAIQGAINTLKKNRVYVTIASYHVVDGKKTCYFLEKFLSDLGYKTKTDFPKHLTTFAWKS